MQTTGMQNTFFLVVQVCSSALFICTLLVGGYLCANFQKLFGVDPNMPGETGSSRAYSKVQVFSVWAHAVCLTGAFAFLLH
jgi:hypothetical protein